MAQLDSRVAAVGGVAVGLPKNNNHSRRSPPSPLIRGEILQTLLFFVRSRIPRPSTPARGGGCGGGGSISCPTCGRPGFGRPWRATTPRWTGAGAREGACLPPPSQDRAVVRAYSKGELSCISFKSSLLSVLPPSRPWRKGQAPRVDLTLIGQVDVQGLAVSPWRDWERNKRCTGEHTTTYRRVRGQQRRKAAGGQAGRLGPCEL